MPTITIPTIPKSLVFFLTTSSAVFSAAYYDRYQCRAIINEHTITATRFANASSISHPAEPLRRIAVCLAPRDDFDETRVHAHRLWAQYIRPVLDAAGVEHTLLLANSPAAVAVATAKAVLTASAVFRGETQQEPTQTPVSMAATTTGVLCVGKLGVVPVLAGYAGNDDINDNSEIALPVGCVPLAKSRGSGVTGVLGAAWQYLFLQHRDAERCCRAALAVAYTSIQSDEKTDVACDIDLHKLYAKFTLNPDKNKENTLPEEASTKKKFDANAWRDLMEELGSKVTEINVLRTQLRKPLYVYTNNV